MAESVRKAHEAWTHAWATKDASAINALMADDFVYIGPHGHALGRETMLAVIQDPSYRIVSGSRTDMSVRPLGDAAVLIRDRWQGRGEFRGVSFADDHICTFVYHRYPAGWRIVLEHCSLHPDSTERPV